ncbi:MAG: MTAP family purine nucleoside phosphorylase [Chloroflexi bacterium]|nr:MTAP family purine nucleoside phosphorylase [Chloroflexota bacterium]
MKTLLIGGTGFSDMDYLEEVKPTSMRTPFGGTTIYLGQYRGSEAGFLARHGMHHEMLAPQVNYRANIWAAHQLGFQVVLGTSAVASLQTPIAVGDLVLPDQLVDFSKHRADSFFLRSVPMTNPFSTGLRDLIIQIARSRQIPLHEQATYLTVEGPRYETAAEIRLFKSWGMDVLGMTNGTEAALCRELGLCYATIALVTNMGAGLTEQGPDLQRHRSVTQQNLPKFKELALASLETISAQSQLDCEH